MPIANYLNYVAQASDLLPGQINAGHEGSLRVVNLAAQLAQRDGHAEVGLLEEPGSEVVNGCKADCLLLDLGDGTAQVVDVVIADGGKDARLAWMEQDTRPMDRWREPFDWPIPGAPEAPPEPPQTPQEPPTIPPPPADLAPVLVALEGITARLDTLIAAINGQRTEQIAGLAQVAAAAKEGIKLKFGF